jgi:hypothetical protein
MAKKLNHACIYTSAYDLLKTTAKQPKIGMT